MLTCVVGADRHKKQARLVVDAQCIKELAYLPHAGSIKLAYCCGAYFDISNTPRIAGGGTVKSERLYSTVVNVSKATNHVSMEERS